MNPETQTILCPLCRQPLVFSMARGRKTGKPSVALKCPQDGRHFRGFINDQEFVARVMGAADQAGQGGQRG